VMGAADYFVVRRRTNKQLRMTKEEVKQENKNTEGDPLVKAQIRSRQMAMARNRQMADVPTADVVLVNPTHVAVALRYEPTKGAPRVVAKGQGPVATKIRELAAEHRVPMVQDVPLARALHGGCEVGAEIPAEFYGAVAKVLAFVMSLKARGSAAGLHRSPHSAPTAA
jgi:flagellar biosynthetic protein FlhB